MESLQLLVNTLVPILCAVIGWMVYRHEALRDRVNVMQVEGMTRKEISIQIGTIIARIDQNEEKAAEQRHELRDAINELRVQVALLNQRLEGGAAQR